MIGTFFIAHKGKKGDNMGLDFLLWFSCLPPRWLYLFKYSYVYSSVFFYLAFL